MTRAIRAMRAAEPAPEADAALTALRAGLEHHFAAAGMAVDLSDAMCVELHRIREIREGIAGRIAEDLAALDALEAGLQADGEAWEQSFGRAEPSFANWYADAFGGARHG